MDYMWPGLKMMGTLPPPWFSAPWNPSSSISQVSNLIKTQCLEQGNTLGSCNIHCCYQVEPSGVITKLTILCPPRPNAVNIAFFACSSFEHVLGERSGELGTQALLKWACFHPRGRFWLVTCGFSSERHGCWLYLICVLTSPQMIVWSLSSIRLELSLKYMSVILGDKESRGE